MKNQKPIKTIDNFLDLLQLDKDGERNPWFDLEEGIIELYVKNHVTGLIVNHKTAFDKTSTMMAHPNVYVGFRLNKLFSFLEDNYDDIWLPLSAHGRLTFAGKIKARLPSEKIYVYKLRGKFFYGCDYAHSGDGFYEYKRQVFDYERFYSLDEVRSDLFKMMDELDLYLKAVECFKRKRKTVSNLCLHHLGELIVNSKDFNLVDRFSHCQGVHGDEHHCPYVLEKTVLSKDNVRRCKGKTTKRKNIR